MHYLFILFVLFLSGSLLSQEQAKTKYIWPLKINNGYSSSFQEFRNSHFHGGIDLRTFRKTGYPVHAITSGRVYKLRMVKRGSGRGVYVKHDDGNVSIFFHLEKFSEPLEKILRRTQAEKKKKYVGNIFLKKGVRVNQGDVVGYSGETGSGLPHLHLEIRDSQYHAINPFPLLKFPAKDRNFPVLKSIILRNRGDSLINGGIGDNRFKLKKIAPHTYGVSTPIVVTGPFDVILHAFDISDTGKYVAPRSLQVSLDQQAYFKLEFQRFKRDDNNQLGFVYDMRYSTSGSLYFNLFHQQGFEMESRKHNLLERFQQLAEGKHILSIEFEDNHGNVSGGSIPFIKLPKPSVQPGPIRILKEGLQIPLLAFNSGGADEVKLNIWGSMGRKLYTAQLNPEAITPGQPLLVEGKFKRARQVEFDFIKDKVNYFSERFLIEGTPVFEITNIDFDIFVNRQTIYLSLDPNPSLRLEVRQGGEVIQVEPEFNARRMVFRFKPLNQNYRMDLIFKSVSAGKDLSQVLKKLPVILLRNGQKRRFYWKGFIADFQSRTVREPRLLVASTRDLKSEFPVLSEQISLEPYHFPFLDEVYYQFLVPKNVGKIDQLGIFKYDLRRGIWKYVYTQYRSKSRLLKTRLRSSGIFAVMRDNFPPAITFKGPRRNYLKNLKRLVVFLSDKGKGINDETLKITLNGTPLEAEFDPDRGWVILESLPTLRRGKNHLQVRVKDHGGNETRKKYRFHLK